MNPELLDILDRGLRYSLWLFLACYLVILFIGWSRLRRRKRQIGELFEQMHTPEEEAEWSRKTSLLNEWPVVFNGLILSLVVGILFFLVYCFVPLPFAQNLVTTSNWQVTRLMALGTPALGGSRSMATTARTPSARSCFARVRSPQPKSWTS